MDRVFNGLSPSSFSLFQGCQRKYFYRKIAKLPVDSDAVEDYSAFQIGKAFHQCLEDVKHELKDYPLAEVAKVCESYGVTEADSILMIFAMLGEYRKTHEKSGLRAIACEQVIDTPAFYGIVDVVLEETDGSWWIGDMKTAATFYGLQEKTLQNHPQLNLYARHYADIASKLKIDPDGYRGCRYRVTTKSKLIQKKTEGAKEYIDRMAAGIKSLDFIIPKDFMRPEEFFKSHQAALRHIEENSIKLDPDKFPQNFGNCTAYFRPCEYSSRCYGCNFTEGPKLEVVANT